MRRDLQQSLGAVALIATSGCGGAGEPIASFEYDLGERKSLYSYAPSPASDTRQADQISKKMFGFETQSPQTPYVCVWRDTGPSRSKDGGASRPSEIFLTCIFGADAWTPPKSLLSEATERQKRDEAVVRAQWDWNGSRYRLSRFEVEIRDGASNSSFRSINFDEEVRAISFVEGEEMKFPASSSEPFAFRISATIPQRYNRGDRATEPKAVLTISGMAEPMPKWLLY
jgi:hypothetical protein